MVLRLIFNSFSVSFRLVLTSFLFKVTISLLRKAFIRGTTELLKTSEGIMADRMKLPIKILYIFYLKNFSLQFPNYAFTSAIKSVSTCSTIENKPLQCFYGEIIRILFISKPYITCHLSKLPDRDTQNLFLCEHTLLLSPCYGFLFLTVMLLFLLRETQYREPKCVGLIIDYITQVKLCFAFLFCKIKENKASFLY